MAGERYRHLFLPGPTRTRGFTNPQRGGSGPRIRERDRHAHSQFLEQRLLATWNDADERRAVIQVERNGAYVEFASDPGFDLMVQGLEATRSGIRLTNIRTVGEGRREQTLATVYVPSAKRGYFLRKVRAYAQENTRGREPKPKNANLINSIADIHLALLESFWRTDELPFMPADAPEWIEVWLSSDHVAAVDRVRPLLHLLRVDASEEVLKFPERTVLLIRASRAQLEQLIEASDDIAEFRIARQVATHYTEMENRDQAQAVRDLLARCNFEDPADIAVCILDCGVNNGHSLIEPVLAAADLYAVRPEWGTADDQGHGTLMAGTAAYGDLLAILEGGGPVLVSHRLESAKILPPPPEQNEKRLWGYVTAQGIYRPEIERPLRRRIHCMAVTSSEDRDRGRPSSWSAELDSLASGSDDERHRLIVVSAGNVADPENWRNYPDDNLTNEVHDPGQSWNALTVGAFTEKTRIIDPTLAAYTAVAPAGGLSPFSTTSTTWPPRKWPIKPEIVLEGGNVAREPRGAIFATDDLKLLSTNRDPQVAQFAPFWATSAASAQAAWMAAQIQVRYPDAWPETVRGLLVHSAIWTENMRRFLRDESKASYAWLLRICGYGVPSLEGALHCASESLTLISQATMQPFDKRDNRYVTRDMHLYHLPWPAQVLRDLGGTEVTMRVTLSYFVEPAPGEIGWENRYRYASHALRFDVNGPLESPEEFVQRVNHQAREEGEHPGTAGPEWLIGEARNVGSIHSDIWKGRAADLAQLGTIAVYPAVGWWRERANLQKWNKTCRYCLIVSIYARGQEVDIYTPIALQLGIAIPIPVA